jgi:hypothetical protein
MTADRMLRLRREAWGFAVGSACFLVGAVPLYAQAVGLVLTDLTFFVGALFFTAAAFIQLALSGRGRPGRGSRSDALDWWASSVQFAGTLFFNLSTTEALVGAVDSGGDASSGWRPDAFGSVCFLLSSVLGVMATTQRDRLWDPNARAWRCTWLNLAGSFWFAVSAIGAYVPRSGDQLVNLFWANGGTFLGAACFLAAALLSRPAPETPGPPRPGREASSETGPSR